MCFFTNWTCTIYPILHFETLIHINIFPCDGFLIDSCHSWLFLIIIYIFDIDTLLWPGTGVSTLCMVRNSSLSLFPFPYWKIVGYNTHPKPGDMIIGTNLYPCDTSQCENQAKRQSSTHTAYFDFNTDTDSIRNHHIRSKDLSIEKQLVDWFFHLLFDYLISGRGPSTRVTYIQLCDWDGSPF